MTGTEPDAKAIFCEALEKPTEAERAAYLDAACRGNSALRGRVEGLLRAHGEAGSFIEGPAGIATIFDAEPQGEDVGEVIGPYKLMEQIGEGGMGVVYVADQAKPVRRRVALKVIKPGMDSRQVVARFEAERQALAMMDHPNIAKVLDGGATRSGRPYFVMELVHGIPITEYCDRERLPIPERLDLFVLVCRAVQHAHQKGVIHRDLKPSNVLVTVIDGAAVPKVIDFGVAKATGQALTEKTIYTAFHQMMGTPLYMSPEQADLSSMDVDTRSDVYSLGVLLYELLTGTTPFDPETLKRAAFDEVRRIIREQEPPRPSTRLSTPGEALSTASARRKSDPRSLGRSMRGELDWVVMKALEKDRRRRYETASDFAADVMNYLADRPVEACPPGAWYRFSKYARRNRVALTTGALVGLALIAGTVASARQAVRATRAEHRAQADFQRAKDTVDRIFTRVAEDLKKTPGMEHIQRALLEDALEFYQDFLATHGDDPGVRHEAARAAHRVGSIYELIGQNDKVEKPLKQAVGLLDKLVADAPREAAYRVDLAECHSDLGAVLGISHRTRESIEERRMALAQYERLVRDHPEEKAYQRKFASRQCNLGLALSTEGETQYQEAERHLRASLDAWGRYQKGVPSRPEDEIELARLHHWMGHLLMSTNRSDEAEAEFNTALTLLARLHAKDPGNPELAARYAHTKGYLRMLKADRGQVEEAERLCRESIALLEPIARVHPMVVYYARRLAIEHHGLALLRWAMGRPADADAAFRRAVASTEKLVDEHRGADQFLHMLAHLLYDRGMFLEETGRPREAADAFRRYMAIIGDLIARHPDRIGIQASLIECLALCPSPQFRDQDRAIRLAKQLLQKSPEASESWGLLGVAHYRQGDLTSAVEALERAVELDPGDRYAPLCLAMTRWRQGDQEQARALYEKAARTIEERNSADMKVRFFRSEAMALLGVKPSEKVEAAK
jgi:serine/threonine protein kinase